MSTAGQPVTGRQADRDNESGCHRADPSRLTSANSPKMAARPGCREGRISCAEIGVSDRPVGFSRLLVDHRSPHTVVAQTRLSGLPGSPRPAPSRAPARPGSTALPVANQGEISGLSRSISNLGSSLGTARSGSVRVSRPITRRKRHSRRSHHNDGDHADRPRPHGPHPGQSRAEEDGETPWTAWRRRPRAMRPPKPGALTSRSCSAVCPSHLAHAARATVTMGTDQASVPERARLPSASGRCPLPIRAGRFPSGLAAGCSSIAAGDAPIPPGWPVHQRLLP